MSDEIDPPWKKFPQYEALDPFWNQGGEAWFHYVWRPFFEGLSKEDQADYLARHEVNDDWKIFYFDKALDKLDDD